MTAHRFKRGQWRLGPRDRRRRYGITAPGAYAPIPAWWSRARWRSELLADLTTDEVTELRAGVGARGPVSVRAIYAVAVAILAAADGATGRNAMPGNAALTSKPTRTDEPDTEALAHLSMSSGYGLTTVQKAVRVLTCRGWLVLIRAGKNRLTSAERSELWRNGSKARQRRNVWACTTPRQGAVDNLVDHQTSIDPGCDLPTTRRVLWVPFVGHNKNINSKPTIRIGAPRRAPSRTGNQRRYAADERAVELATDLRARIPWLRHVPHRRIMPSLHRFATAGWTGRELQRHLDQLLQQRGWTVPGTPAKTLRDHRGTIHHQAGTTMRSPWGYLAFLLRHLDPGDLAIERQHAVEAANVDRYRLQLMFGAPCPHGQPAGDVPSPNAAFSPARNAGHMRQTPPFGPLWRVQVLLWNVDDVSRERAGRLLSR